MKMIPKDEQIIKTVFNSTTTKEHINAILKYINIDKKDEKTLGRLTKGANHKK